MKQALHGPALALGLALSALPAGAAEVPLADSPTWAAIAGDILGDAVPADGAGLFAVAVPVRAEDAATVPVVVTQTDPGPAITGMTLVIDENPSPVAGTFTFGAAMHPLRFETRVRVNQYSNLRVIAATAEGSFMTGHFVKASGGCSAPATKDPAAALAGMGEMRLKLFAPKPAALSGQRREAQILIRHPNYSGLQRDQVTQLFIPAHFIDRLEVRQGEELLFTLEGGISISENPAFRFDYTDNGAPALSVHATDTEGNVFDVDLPKDPPA